MTTEIIPADPQRSASPFDGNNAEFKGNLARRGENRRAFIEWVRSALVDGTDFGAIKRRDGSMTKPSLRKPGAEKICGMLGVVTTFPTLKDYEQAVLNGVPIGQIILRCHLLAASGDVVADGVGARSLEQDNGDLNKALKMACKSAHIDATLRMAGLSEIFTQDLEDMPPENVGGESEQRRTSEPQRGGKPATQPPRSTGGRGFATEKQVYLIERRLNDAGVEARDLCEHFDVESLVKIPFAKVNDVLAWIAEEHA
jgi:hypothetical protein